MGYARPSTNVDDSEQWRPSEREYEIVTGRTPTGAPTTARAADGAAVPTGGCAEQAWRRLRGDDGELVAMIQWLLNWPDHGRNGGGSPMPAPTLAAKDCPCGSTSRIRCVNSGGEATKSRSSMPRRPQNPARATRAAGPARRNAQQDSLSEAFR